MPDPIDEFLQDLDEQLTYPGTNKPVKTSPVEESAPVDDELDWRTMGKVYRFSGKEVVFFPIGALALALNRRPVTIRSWEQKGWLPKPRFRGPHTQGEGRRRLYTEAQINEIVRVAREEGILDPVPRRITDTDFVERVKDVLES